uniref:Rad21/Rec8-like protein N-terminal domain-containing protein n=1 Tax=Kwoniella pini CBS 10737 TaxID=1296096 RepID=A0A1B9I141_9TREE|nr:uncharacterized protein I206_04950 [Kwoniella pini CBS 10737]OCF49262.1 hypothetical protein I206_04950 [Kwoniella pini CBS 10737]
MFFSEDLLTNKNGTLAATLGPRSKKITKKQLTSVDLSRTCDLIAEPPEPLALRLSGSLLVGVTRVYNQNYDVFYSDVTNFHQNLRRSIATDFATNGDGSSGTTSLDLPGGGRSRTDVITFPDSGLNFDFGLNLQFQHIDWHDPLSTGRTRRSSSKLSSQATQEDSEEEHEDEDNEEDEAEEEVGRNAKRKKYSSSPFVGPTTVTRARTSVHHPSEPTALYAGINVPMGEIDLGLDLEGMNGGFGDESFSGPSGRDFEMPVDGEEGMIADQADLVPPSRPGSAPPGEQDMLVNDGSNSDFKGIRKRRLSGAGSDEESVKAVEQQLIGEPKQRKVKKVKKVTFDDLKLSHGQDAEARRRYRDVMKEQKEASEFKVRDKASHLTAAALVDSTGGLEFFDADMKSFFSTFTQVKSFKWETDTVVHRLGIEHEEPQAQDDDQRQGEYDISGGDGDAPMMGIFQSYDIPIQELSASARQSRLHPDPEQARRYSQGSQQGPLPASLSILSRFPDLGDTSFSPATLRLSVMTPQEAKLRSRSIHHSSGPGSLGRRRARSSSLISNRPDDDPLLLVHGNDLELPGGEEEFQLESLAASQQARLADLPAAFKPEMLAALETQCRDFFTFVERKMVTLSIDELDFEDLVPVESKKHVAAVAFYDCLTLATKKILTVKQGEAWGPIRVSFAVAST